jgi:hypothetical protein
MVRGFAKLAELATIWSEMGKKKRPPQCPIIAGALERQPDGMKIKIPQRDS